MLGFMFYGFPPDSGWRLLRRLLMVGMLVCWVAAWLAEGVGFEKNTGAGISNVLFGVGVLLGLCYLMVDVDDSKRKGGDDDLL